MTIVSDTTRRLCVLVSRELRVDLDKVVPAASLIADLGADHIDVVGIAIDIEDEFGVALTDTQIERVETVADLLGLIGGDADPVAQAA